MQLCNLNQLETALFQKTAIALPIEDDVVE